MRNKRLIAFLWVFVVSTLNAQQYSSQADYGAQPSYSSQASSTDYSEGAGSVEINNMVSGNVYESESHLIIDGATFVNNSSDTNLIKSGINGKKVILNNVSIVSNNASATLVDLSDGGNNDVHIKNLRVRANNSNVYDEDCATSVCLSNSNHNTVNNLSVTLSGNNKFNAGK